MPTGRVSRRRGLAGLGLALLVFAAGGARAEDVLAPPDGYEPAVGDGANGDTGDAARAAPGDATREDAPIAAPDAVITDGSGDPEDAGDGLDAISPLPDAGPTLPAEAPPIVCEPEPTSSPDPAPPPPLCLEVDPTPPVLVPPPLLAPTEPIVRPPPKRTPIAPSEAIKAILGLLILMTLAYLAGHPAVVRLEQRLRISQVITAGFPFVLFGLAARSDGIGILSPQVLDEIAPILPLGLGWIGFTIGSRFDLRRLENLPTGVGTALILTTILPFVAVAGTTSLLFGLMEGIDDSSFLRDALLLATAGAMTARTVPILISTRGAEASAVDRVARIIKLEEVIAFVGLILVAAFFRPADALVGWRLPSVGWVFVTIGVGTILGGLVFALLRTIRGQAETLVVMLGSICLAAGMASFLRLSPIVVCFLAGTLVANLPGAWREQVSGALTRLERPIYLVFLVLAGAYWRVDEWQGWVLMLLFVLTRLSTRFIGVRLFTGQHPDALTPVEQRNLAASPMGALSIAIVINAQDLYSGQTLPWIVHAVIGGSLLTELVVQVFALGRNVATLAPLAPLRPKTLTNLTARATLPPPTDGPDTPAAEPEAPTPHSAASPSPHGADAPEDALGPRSTPLAPEERP